MLPIGNECAGTILNVYFVKALATKDVGTTFTEVKVPIVAVKILELPVSILYQVLLTKYHVWNVADEGVAVVPGIVTPPILNPIVFVPSWMKSAEKGDEIVIVRPETVHVADDWIWDKLDRVHDVESFAAIEASTGIITIILEETGILWVGLKLNNTDVDVPTTVLSAVADILVIAPPVAV